MGNRAVVSFGTSPKSPALYFHWNGGRASIVGFMAACRELECHSIDDIEFALRPWFGRITLYRETVESADKNNGDNGWYILSSDLEIATRRYAPRSEEHDADKTQAIKAEIIASNLGHCRYSFAREA